MHKTRRFISQEKSFSSRFFFSISEISANIKKNRLNKSLKMKVEKNILRGLFITDVFFKEPDDWKSNI